MYLTIDPGRHLGWALWNVRGLVACGLGDPRSHPRHVVTSDAADVDVIHDVWIEDQIIYPRSPVPPNDVLTLAKSAHRMAGRYDLVGVIVHFVKPSDWKGQVPKDIHHARVWASMDADEQEIANLALKGVAPSLRHNVLDALGLGVWVRSIGAHKNAKAH